MLPISPTFTVLRTYVAKSLAPPESDPRRTPVHSRDLTGKLAYAPCQPRRRRAARPSLPGERRYGPCSSFPGDLSDAPKAVAVGGPGRVFRRGGDAADGDARSGAEPAAPERVRRHRVRRPPRRAGRRLGRPAAGGGKRGRVDQVPQGDVPADAPGRH